MIAIVFNIKGFKNSISLVDWDFISQDKDPENANFLNKIKGLYNIYCPMKTIRVSNRKTPRKPWVTPGILKLIKTKDKMYKKYINELTSENKVKHTKYRNLINNLLRTSKKSYITSEIESNKFKMKETLKKKKKKKKKTLININNCQ